MLRPQGPTRPAVSRADHHLVGLEELHQLLGAVVVSQELHQLLGAVVVSGRVFWFLDQGLSSLAVGAAGSSGFSSIIVSSSLPARIARGWPLAGHCFKEGG